MTIPTEEFNDEIFNKEFEEGLALFNEKSFFECHEVWEALWMRVSDDRAHVLKGLLQAAIAIHHFRRHNFEGARKLYEGQKRILAPSLPAAIGVDLARFAREMDACCAPLRLAISGDAPRLDINKIPTIHKTNI
ncbi:MAG: DUF309 domain-containing protein [Planctomycetes bacterium]|nr:DUF309 domain-containing protein [Planctomycetota bacterium]